MSSKENNLTYATFRTQVVKDTPQIAFDAWYRKMSYPLSFLLYKIGLSANAVSLISIVLVLAGGLCFVLSLPVAGLVLLMIGYLFDFCDGNIARFRARQESVSNRSILGLVLENLNTNLNLLVFAIGLGWYFSVRAETDLLFLLGATYFCVHILYRYSSLHVVHLTKGYIGSRDSNAAPKKHLSRLARIKYFLSKGLYASNCQYPLMLGVVLVVPAYAPDLFAFYLATAVLYTTVRAGALLERASRRTLPNEEKSFSN